MGRRRPARSSSLESALSRITVDNKDHSRSTASPSTPPTSRTDAASDASSASTTKDIGLKGSRRVSRVRVFVPSYNENVLSGTSRKTRAVRNLVDTVCNLSGETLAPENSENVPRQLVEESIRVLNLDWSVDAMPGDEIQGGFTSKATLRDDSKGMRQVAVTVEHTKSVLGKRRRDAIDVVGKLHTLGKRASLRLRRPLEEVSSFAVRKKARQAEVEETHRDANADVDRKSTPSLRKKKKQWLSQGLYVGQDPDFDPRLSDAKNKLKRAASRDGSQPVSRRKILPMPLFAGKRVLEQGRDFRLPWDVFSPLPTGQPKPEEWRKTQKNVFVGEAADIWKTSKKLEHSTCICTENSGCDENCFNRFMFYECDDSNCNIGSEYCRNRSFEELRKRCKAGGKYNIGVEVIKTADRGYGVRSNRTFEPNQIIVEYTGEIITQDECDDRMKKRYKNNECFYLMIFDQNMIIDATRGSIARFVNHSCEPNCKMVKWTVAGKPRMALFAGENGIMTGEELTYDYNFDPFSSKNIQECHCGTPSCRGVLGPKPKEREIKDALKPLAQVGTKRKLQQAMQDAMQNVSKKRKIVMPKSAKAAVGNLKTQASSRFIKARILASTKSQNARLVKKAFDRSMRDSKSAQKKAPITSTQSKKGSAARIRKGTDYGPVQAQRSVRKVAACVRQNTVGKSIRVVKS